VAGGNHRPFDTRGEAQVCNGQDNAARVAHATCAREPMPSAHLMQQNKHPLGACNAMAADLVNVHQSALDPRPLTNVLIMSVGFFFIKGGFIPVQSFASSLLNFSCIPMGDISIGLVRDMCTFIRSLSLL